jgi:hypothetical protein
MARTSNNAGAHPPALPANAVTTETPDSGVIPPQGGTEAAPAGKEVGSSGASPDLAVGTETPPVDTRDNPEGSEEELEKALADGYGIDASQDTATDGDNPEGKVKVKHKALKGRKITLPNGKIAAFDENGILEVDGKTAEYLLSIPGYEKG